MKRGWIVSVAIVLLAWSLAACGASQSSSTPGNDSASATNGASAPSGKTVKLTFGTWANFADVEAIKDKLPEFYAKNPGIEVVFESTPFDEYNQKLLTMATAKSSDYDLLFVEASSTPTLVGGGVLEPLDAYFEKSGAMKQDDYLLEETSMVDGVTYVIPEQIDARIAIYNKDILAAAGFATPPATIDEFIDYTRKAKDAGYNPLALRYSLFWTPMYEWGMFLFSEGGSFVKQDENGKWAANLDNETTRQWIQRVREISSTVKGDALMTMNDTAVYASMEQGVSGATLAGAWFWAETDESLHDKLVPALAPKGSVTSASMIGGARMGISANSKHKEEAWKFFEWLHEPEIAAAICGGLPGLKAAYDYVPEELRARYKLFQEQIEMGGSTIVPAGFPLATQVANALVEPFQKATFTDQMSLEDAAKSLNAAVQKAIDENLDQ